MKRSASQSLPKGAHRVPDDDRGTVGGSANLCAFDSLGKPKESNNITAALGNVSNLRYSSGMSIDTASSRYAALLPLKNKPSELLVPGKSVTKKSRAKQPSFSTTMTARQAAATLETICQGMGCTVKRIDERSTHGVSVVKLRVTRAGARIGCRTLRSVRAHIVLAEHGTMRTDVYLRKRRGLFSDRSAFVTLSHDIWESMPGR